MCAAALTPVSLRLKSMNYSQLPPAFSRVGRKACVHESHWVFFYQVSNDWSICHSVCNSIFAEIKLCLSCVLSEERGSLTEWCGLCLVCGHVCLSLSVCAHVCVCVWKFPICVFTRVMSHTTHQHICNWKWSQSFTMPKTIQSHPFFYLCRSYILLYVVVLKSCIYICITH